jgi:hypothetical protein
MYSTKSFCNILAFASNEPGVVSPIGELTTYAKTFTRDLSSLHHSTIDGFDLFVFSSDSNSVAVTMDQTVADRAIALVDCAVRGTLAHVGEIFHDEALQSLMTFAETNGIFNVQIGHMVNANSWWVPEWISFSSTTIAGENIHKVWLGLEAFKVQYTDYKIVVIPPFENLDLFFNPGSIVENQVKAITPSQMMEQADVAKAGNPETMLRTDPYEYRDPINTSRRFDVYWTVVIYGQAGNDPDLIRDELVNYILANSTHTRAQWALLFPDIFKRTEFIFAPFWDQYAAEQRVFSHGVYSPILEVGSIVPWMKEHAPEYAPLHVENNTTVMSWPYRSLQVASIGHVENKDGRVRISNHYPDFISVGTESTDFNRMSVETQTWAMMMMELIILAENLNDATDMPRGTFRIERLGKTYVGKTHNRVLFLVAPKGE